MQGPWTRTNILDKSGSYQYLHPKLFEELFSISGNGEDIANAIIYHLQKETPDRYKFNYVLSIISDTVIIQTNDSIADFEAVKNELTASYALNNFAAINIIQFGKPNLFRLNDVTVPYMDLVFPTNEESLAEAKHNNIQQNKFPIWLIISIFINVLLIILLLKPKSR